MTISTGARRAQAWTPFTSSGALRATLWAIATLSGACAEDDVTPPSMDASAQPDAQQRIDAAAPGVDAGPAPACDVAAEVRSLGVRPPGVTGIDAFGRLRDGLVALLREEEENRRALVALSPTSAPTELFRTEDPALRLGRAQVASDDDRLWVASDRTTLDEEGRVVGTDVELFGLSSAGSTARATVEGGTSPLLASSEGPGVWLFRSDVSFEPVVNVTPRLQRLDASGNAAGAAFGLSASQVRIEATELTMVATPTGLAVAYIVPPSTLVVLPFTRNGEGLTVGAGGQTSGVPSLDAVAVAPDGTIAVVFAETLSSQAEVGVVVLDGSGRERRRTIVARFDELETPVRAAVVAAWPAFTVLWRGGEGSDATLEGAGVSLDGTVLVPAQPLVATPNMRGPLRAVSGADTIAVAYEAQEASTTVELVEVCPPGT